MVFWPKRRSFFGDLETDLVFQVSGIFDDPSHAAGVAVGEVVGDGTLDLAAGGRIYHFDRVRIEPSGQFGGPDYSRGTVVGQASCLSSLETGWKPVLRPS